PIGEFGGGHVRAAQIEFGILTVKCAMTDEHKPKLRVAFLGFGFDQPLENVVIGLRLFVLKANGVIVRAASLGSLAPGFGLGLELFAIIFLALSADDNQNGWLFLGAGRRAAFSEQSRLDGREHNDRDA